MERKIKDSNPQVTLARRSKPLCTHVRYLPNMSGTSQPGKSKPIGLTSFTYA